MRFRLVAGLVLSVVGAGALMVLGAAPAAADVCTARAQAVRAGKVPYGAEDPDCDTAAKNAALVSWVAAGLGAAGAAAAAAQRRRGGKAAPPDHWPKDLKAANSFCGLGSAIAQEPYLQSRVPTGDGGDRPLTELERSLYVFERMREAARVYGLRAARGNWSSQVTVAANRPEGRAALAGLAIGALGGGVAGSAFGAKFGAGLGSLAGPAGTLLGGFAGGLLGLMVGRWVGSKLPDDSPDADNAEALKNAGIGNCGEWSYAFNKVLECAGVRSRVIVADSNQRPGAPDVTGSWASNDTAVMVQDSGGGGSRRIFDPYRQFLHNPDNRPDDASEWTNLPMTPDDRLPYDDDRKGSWQQYIGGKPAIKAAEDGGIIWSQ